MTRRAPASRQDFLLAGTPGQSSTDCLLLGYSYPLLGNLILF